MKGLKRLFAIFTLSSVILTSVPAFADSDAVTISFPNFPVSINSITVDNNRLEYPLIVYNNITYFPMTYAFSMGLGLNINFDLGNGLSISNAGAPLSAFTVNYVDDTGQRPSVATLPLYNISVNNSVIDNQTEPYPLLNYKGVTYFPLTWHYAVDAFGWKYSYSQNSGLSIKSGTSATTPSTIDTPTDALQPVDTPSTSDVKALNSLDYTINLPVIFNTYDSLGSGVRAKFIRDQGNSSTCWAFAANTLFEVSLAKERKIYLDFSEDNLILNSPIPVTYDSGGNIEIASAYYNNWLGPIIDPDDVFGDGTSSSTIKPEYVLTDYIELNHSVENMKYAIYQYGGVQSSIGYDETREYYNEDTSGFYNYDADSNPTHDIVIVGWDDTFSRTNFLHKPGKDGAFIVQNSWGQEWGDAGLFYVSYEDVHISNKAVAFTGIDSVNNSKKQYFLDETGITHYEGFTDCYQATGLNVYKSAPASGNGKKEYITEVGFYTNASDIDFKISFVEGDMPETLFPEMTEIAEGTTAFPGYHTVTLDHPIELTPDQNFLIAVTYENEETIFLVPLESPYPNIDYNITGNTGESYISPDPEYYGYTDISSARENSNVGIRVITEFR